MQAVVTLQIEPSVEPHFLPNSFHYMTLPACDESCNGGVGKVAALSLHADVALRADRCQKLERLCRYISRPAVAEKCLSLTPNCSVRYQSKAPYRDGNKHVSLEPLDFVALLGVPGAEHDLR